MSNQTKYLLTVDSVTGAAVKLERLGEAGDLVEVPLSMLGGFQPVASVPVQAAAQPMVVNIYLGGAAQAGAAVSVQPAPGAEHVLMGPGATARPGGPAGPGTSLTGPGGPGGPAITGATLAGPAGPAGPGGPGGPAVALSGPGSPAGPAGPGAGLKGPGSSLTQ